MCGSMPAKTSSILAVSPVLSRGPSVHRDRHADAERVLVRVGELLLREPHERGARLAASREGLPSMTRSVLAWGGIASRYLATSDSILLRGVDLVAAQKWDVPPTSACALLPDVARRADGRPADDGHVACIHESRVDGRMTMGMIVYCLVGPTRCISRWLLLSALAAGYDDVAR